eukprot:PhF_6_TR41503/c1_g2_i1/m.62900
MKPTTFCRGFGLFVMLLCTPGIFAPDFVVNTLNQQVVSPLGLDKFQAPNDAALVLYTLGAAVGFIYVLNGGSPSFAINSIFTRFFFAGGLLYLILTKKIGNGFLLFVVQDGGTAIIQLLLTLLNGSGAEKPKRK